MAAVCLSHLALCCGVPLFCLFISVEIPLQSYYGIYSPAAARIIRRSCHYLRRGVAAALLCGIAGTLFLFFGSLGGFSICCCYSMYIVSVLSLCICVFIIL